MANIFEKIEELANKGYFIDYMIQNQIENGLEEWVEKGYIPLITYTVNVMRVNDGEYIYAESFDHLKECLEAGIKFVENTLKQ